METIQDMTSPLSRERQPIAIVGIGCRLPGGVTNPEALWRLLLERTDAISDVPPDRWNHTIFYHPEPGKPGKTVAKQAGFIDHIDLFDCGFFGISPREASQMDPQHRLLLETSWEALDDAGLSLDTLAGSTTGVFMGISTHEYPLRQTIDTISTHTSTGQAACMAANRISYAFDFTGPSIAVDTACSSSLVAVHAACTSIWNRESSLALAGGVNLLIDPNTFVGFSNLSMLSPDSRCFAFDERANGFVRSEGAGVLILKPLMEALADNDRVYAVILDTAVNQDGHSQGLTFPSQASQEKMLQDVYSRSGVAPHQVCYVEAHGTGTQAGDPVETNAIGQILGQSRPPGEELLIGSVKTNIGHLEAGAGIAGIIKACLVLKHRLVPPNLHFYKPNPQIPFDDLRLKVPTEAISLTSEEPVIAGVNSFGFGGTNAHVILAEAPAAKASAEPEASKPSNRSYLLPLSARSSEALRDQAGAYGKFLAEMTEQGEPSLADLCYSAGVRGTHHPFRLAVAGATAEELRTRLETYVAGEKPTNLFHGRVTPGKRPKVAFMFTGQGSQWWGMARELLATEPVFREVMQRCDRIVTELTDWSLLTVYAAAEADSKMDRTAYAQPALFALQAGLLALWRSWGVTPDAVVGHSVGEIASAYAAGIMDLDEAMRVAVHRGRLMDRATAQGKMLAVGSSREEIVPFLVGYEERVALAAINSHVALTLSGEPQALEEIRKALKRAKIGSKFLPVNYAFHSQQMEPVQGELLAALAELKPRAATTRIVSTVTGENSPGSEWDAGYWWKNLRQTVCFEPAVSGLIRDGFTIFLEIGPQPALAGPVKDSLHQANVEGAVLASLQKGKSDRETLLATLAHLHLLAVPVAWQEVNPPGRIVRRPAYPWQRERCWSEDESRVRLIFVSPDHPLLGTKQLTAGSTWTQRLDLRALAYLKHHSLQGAPVFPATGYLEMALAAGRAFHDSELLELEDISFENPCFLTENSQTPVEFRLFPEDMRFEIFSRAKSDASWIRNANGRLSCFTSAVAPVAAPPREIIKECGAALPGPELYQLFTKAGLDYGAEFQGIQTAWRGEYTALGEVDLPSGLEVELNDYLIHPALLDACFQTILVALPEATHSARPRGAFLPVSLDRLRLYQRPGTHVFSQVSLRSFSEDALVADLLVLNDQGMVLVEVKGLRCQAVASDSATQSPMDELLFQSCWQIQPRPEPASAQGRAVEESWLIFADQGGAWERLEERLGENVRIIPVHLGDNFAEDGQGGYSIDPEQPETLQKLLTEISASKAPHLTRVVHLWGLDSCMSDTITQASLIEAERVGSACLLHLIQAIDEQQFTSPPRLLIVTRNAQPMTRDEYSRLCPSQAPLWGLRRVVAFEHPRLRPAIIDITDPDSSIEIDSLLAEMRADLPEDEIIIREEERAVHRYVRTSLDECAPQKTKQVRPTSISCHAASKRLGILDNLKLVASQPPAPGPGEVAIDVKSAGLNFSDVLKALGLYPGATPDTVTFGAECAGVITALGPDLAGQPASIGTNLRIGQKVVALASNCFGSCVTTPAPYVFPQPEGLSFAQAAAIPIVYLTAQYALMDVGRLCRGERILIHAASGGVGLAAIQIARQAGAEIFATAGSPEKRDYLRSLGIERVMDSRSLAFADEVLSATNGEGVDLVLNSLAGEAITKGISVLRPFGRFIEIGKRDIYANARVGLRPFRNNITFTVVDLDQAIRIHPALVYRLFNDVMAGFASGAFTPLPVRTFPLSEMIDAFRYMSKAQHIGKIIIDSEAPPTEVLFPHAKPPVQEDGTYLVTGGIEGFGNSLASWLVDQGARHIVLASRSGPASPSAQAVVNAFAERGCQALVRAADIADPEQLQELLTEIRESLPPLRGIIHAAMVMDNGIITRLDQQRLHAVTRPKILGAWNLHQQTLDQPLDFFLMTSSVSSIFGSPGQANYAAGNAFLDALAHYRQGLGLPALTLNFGAFESVGYIARHPELFSYLENTGIPPISPSEALFVLERVLGSRMAQMGVTRFDFPRLAAGPMGKLMPARFVELLAVHGGNQSGTEEGELLKSLAAVRDEEREGLVLVALVQEMGRVLGVDPEHFDVAQPLSDLGLDSLMTVELITWIEQALNLRLPTVELMRNPTTAELAGLLVDHLDAAASGHSAAEGHETVDLRAEAQLDPSIVPRGKQPPSKTPGEIFLTGATGFVGAFLLRELLDKTTANIHCLVRAHNKIEAKERLRSTMLDYGIWEDALESRIRLLSGDLEQPLLGLTTCEFNTLAGQLDAIYHCGAIVNFVKPYEALRAANVQGTQEVLRLACAERPKTLHYISSIAVFSITHHTGLVSEKIFPHEVDGLADGYSQSKWVAEQLVVAAMHQGLPVRIYRPGVLSGHSETGVSPLNDALLQLFIACCRIGSLPDFDMNIDVTPVDLAVRAIVHISAGENPERVFHLCSPEPTPVKVGASWLRDFGLPLKELPYQQWREILVTQAAKFNCEQLIPLLPESASEAQARVGGRERRFSLDHTCSALADSDISLAPLSMELFVRYMNYLAGKLKLKNL